MPYKGRVSYRPVSQAITPSISPPRFGFRGILDIGDKTTGAQLPYVTTDYTDPVGSLGITHVVLPICTTAVANALTAKGLQSGGWYLGMWNNSTKSWPSAFDTQTEVQNAVSIIKDHAANAGHYYVMADEPDYSAEFITALAQKISWVKGVDPLAKCIFADYDSNGPGNQYVRWANETTIDEVWSSVYSIRGTSGTRGTPGTYDPSIIAGEQAAMSAAKAIRPSMKFKTYIGMHNDVYSSGFGGDAAYSGINARIPSFPGATLATASVDNQIQQQFDAWRSSSLVDGVIIYSWGPSPEQAAGVPPNGWTGWLRGGWGASNFAPRTDLIGEMRNQLLRV